MRHADIIAELGTAEVADRLGVPAARVRVWKSRRIPRSSYAELITAFPQVTLGMLKAGEPGHSGGSPDVDSDTMAAGTNDGAEKADANISRTGIAA